MNINNPRELLGSLPQPINRQWSDWTLHPGDENAGIARNSLCIYVIVNGKTLEGTLPPSDYRGRSISDIQVMANDLIDQLCEKATQAEAPAEV